MLKRSIQDTPSFVAGDETLIREVLHPKNEAIPLPYSLAFATLATGKSSRPHILQTSSEVFVFTQGTGEIFVGEESTRVSTGDVVHVPMGAKQYIKNDSDGELKFWCIVAPSWSKKDEIVL